MHPQPPFFRLPGELRNKIYSLVFSGWQIFPPRSSTHDLDLVCSCRPVNTTLYRSPRSFELLIALTKVNRQLRAETRVLPYKYSGYNFSRPEWFVAWLEQMEEDVRATVWCILTGKQKKAVKRVVERDVWKTGEFGSENALRVLGLQML